MIRRLATRGLDTQRNAWFWRAVIWMTALFALSSVPDDPTGRGPRILLLPPAWHNLVHVPAYALLTWLWWRSMRTAEWTVARSLWASAAIAGAYGILDELHQYFVPGRFLSVTDVLLNFLGCLLAVIWAHRFERDRVFERSPIDSSRA